MSKFSFDAFIDGWNDDRFMCYSKQKYSQEEAIKSARVELFGNSDLIVEEGYVKYGFYMQDDEKRNDWYHSQDKTKGSIPVWVIKESE